MTDTPPRVTTHVRVDLHGVTIDLDKLIDIASKARERLISRAVMRVHFSPAYPGELGSHDTVTLEFEEA